MRRFETVESFRQICDAERRSSKTIGLVPTMGALHAGHVSLMQRARRDGCAVAVSVFVNPTQFGPSEDFQKYPRTLQSDLEICQANGVELVFVPSVEEMYPAGARTRVTVTRLTEGLCGASRPGHFDGVATIVTKLLVATGPCVAYFGRKDYQQYRVVEAMVADLLLPVRIVGCTTVREPDGLALSSRNRYLSPSERRCAVGIVRGIARAERAFRSGDRRADTLLGLVRSSLEQSELREDYVALRGPTELEPLEGVGNLPERVLLAVAAYCGNTRLIDNLVLGEETAPDVAEVT
jgi:pantoate--beta-alanine ligase